MTSAPPKFCYLCKKDSKDATLFQCSRCHQRIYCGQQCQAADWPSHKQMCVQSTKRKAGTQKWYDKYRRCQDGSNHEGNLELITWSCPQAQTGWGNAFLDEADEYKRYFQEDLEGDEEKLYKEKADAFRWTYCGTSASMNYGCDHHGTGSRPCSCDFCRMGKPLPKGIWKEQSAERMGLNLPRGPDTRSFDSGLAHIAAAGRGMLGMDM